VAQRILIIGGNGIISGSVTRLAVKQGMAVMLVNRGTSTTRPPIDGVESMIGDADDAASLRAAVGTREFDVVVNFRAFTPAQVRADVELFSGRTGQYVFVSSASAYQKPVAHLPIVEATPLRNPFWEYSRNKIACEDLLVAEYRESCFPMTIVRPSHTYDSTLIPLDGSWTALDRLRRGVPIVLHGDGTSLWTLTNARDFAGAFVGLLGNPHALGAAVQITSDESLTWNAIAGLLADALGVEARIVHVASETLAKHVNYGDGLLGDKAHSVVFDNSRVKSLVPGWQAIIPFSSGAREIVEWHLADPARRVVDAGLSATYDRLVAQFG